jgi:hypothetical protein
VNAEQRRAAERASLPPSVLAAADEVLDAAAVLAAADEVLDACDLMPVADDYDADDYGAEIAPCDLCGRSARQYGGLYDGLCAACQVNL